MSAVRESDPAAAGETELAATRVLTLNRPEQRNSLVWESWTELDEALDRALADDVRTLVVTGAGPFFCSGGDRDSTPARGERALAAGARIELAHGVLRRLRSAPIAVIAAVEGGAVGLGWGLALCCDLIVVAEDAFFSAPFAALGIVPDGGVTWQLVHRLGQSRASELLFSGRRVTAREALDLGLVTAVTRPGEAMAESLALARSLHGIPAASLDLTKRLIISATTATFDQHLPHELALATFAQRMRRGAQG
jgi:enoyl-CoA hydratase/carnithine racemase